MGKNKKKNEGKKTVAQKAQEGQQKDMTLDERIAVTEAAILEGVKKLASGIDISLSKLIEVGQELIDLETQAEIETDLEEGEDEEDAE